MEQITYILYIYSSLWTILLRSWAKLRCKSITWHVTQLARDPGFSPQDINARKAELSDELTCESISPQSQMSPTAPGMLWPQQVQPRGTGRYGPLHCDETGRLEGSADSVTREGACHFMPQALQLLLLWVMPQRLEMPSPPFPHYLPFPYYFFFYPSFVNSWCGWGTNRALKPGHKYCWSFLSGLFIVDTLKLVAVFRDSCTCGPLITVIRKERTWSWEGDGRGPGWVVGWRKDRMDWIWPIHIV